MRRRRRRRRRIPSAITAAQLRHLCLLAGEKTTLANTLVGSLRGISPQIARELAYRASGRMDAPATDCDPDSLIGALGSDHRDRWRPATGSPALYLRDGVPNAFSPVPLASFAGDPDITVEADPSISAIIARFFAETARASAHGERRNRLLHAHRGRHGADRHAPRALRGELRARRGRRTEPAQGRGDLCLCLCHDARARLRWKPKTA